MADKNISQLGASGGGNIGTSMVPIADPASGAATKIAASAFQADWNNTDPTDQRYINNKPAVGLPYKTYTALLTGTTAGQLLNTIGDGSADGVNDIAWTNPSNGVLNAAMSGGTPFPAGKVFILVGVLDGGGVPYFVAGFRTTDNLLVFEIYKYDGTQTGTPVTTDLPIEIRVYP